MRCFFDHNWGWPRKRGDRDVQVCLNCGVERESKVRFDRPRYTQTQPSATFPPERAAAAGAAMRQY